MEPVPMRRWHVILFSPFNNLPLAVKLGLTTLGAMALLGTLAWIAVAALDTQRELDDRVATSQAAERAGRRALAAVSDMRLAAEQMRIARAPEAVEKAARRADTLAGRVKRLLDEMAGALDDQTTRDVVDRGTGALADYQAKLVDEAKLRQAAIEAYEGFVPLHGHVANAAAALRDTLSHEYLLPELAGQAQIDIAAFIAGAEAAQDAVLTFRVGGDGGPGELETARTETSGARDALGAGVSDMEQHGTSLASLPATQPVLDAVKALVAAGDELGAGSKQALDTAAAAAMFGISQSGPSNRALAGRVDGAISPFVDAAQAARDAAAAALDRARFVLRLISGGAVVLLLVVGAVFIASITRPIRVMTRAMQRIAGGDVAQHIGFEGRRDEVGRMAAALEKLRESVGTAFVQGEMIQQLPVPVMTAEPGGDLCVTYMNEATKTVMRRIERALPVPVSGLIGQSIDIFHPQPEQAREILSDPDRLPFRTTVAIAGETLELNVSALRNADGSYSGPMLTWRVLTQQQQLSEQFQGSVVSIATTVGDSARGMATTADAMSGAAASGAARLEEVANASRAASGHVQAVAAAAEQLAASVAEISRQVAESANIAGGAVAEAEATDRTVAGLADAATRIGDVVRLIQDIAGRTNLLALNATIEAARAGEAGRGFAVVAGEVKTLANQTAKATQEIAGQISAIQQETSHAVAALRSIGGTIRRMSEIATTIAGAVEEQGAATQEIARSVQEAARGTAEVDSTLAVVGV
jgi:methyl-accepting chemotaxis protein